MELGREKLWYHQIKALKNQRLGQMNGIKEDRKIGYYKVRTKYDILPAHNFIKDFYAIIQLL